MIISPDVAWEDLHDHVLVMHLPRGEVISLDGDAADWWRAGCKGNIEAHPAAVDLMSWGALLPDGDDAPT